MWRDSFSDVDQLTWECNRNSTMHHSIHRCNRYDFQLFLLTDPYFYCYSASFLIGTSLYNTAKSYSPTAEIDLVLSHQSNGCLLVQINTCWWLDSMLWRSRPVLIGVPCSAFTMIARNAIDGARSHRYLNESVRVRVYPQRIGWPERSVSLLNNLPFCSRSCLCIQICWQGDRHVSTTWVSIFHIAHAMSSLYFYLAWFRVSPKWQSDAS